MKVFKFRTGEDINWISATAKRVIKEASLLTVDGKVNKTFYCTVNDIGTDVEVVDKNHKNYSSMLETYISQLEREIHYLRHKE